jgi:heme A synthase
VLHRANGLALLASFAVLVALSRHSARLAPLAWTALRLVVVQIAVGALNVWARLPVEVTALHSALAAGIALSAVLLVRELALAGVAAGPAAAPAALAR